MPAVSFVNVTKTYASPRGDVRALDDVSFDIAQGEFFGVVGRTAFVRIRPLALHSGAA